MHCDWSTVTTSSHETRIHFFTFLQEYNETESRRAQENVARQEDCDKLVSDSDAWFTESDICQFMTRKEEDVESAPPLDE